MRDPERIQEVLALVERMWRLYPDWRLGQLLENVATWAEQPLWELEEDALVEDALVAEIERHLAQTGQVIRSE